MTVNGHRTYNGLGSVFDPSDCISFENTKACSIAAPIDGDIGPSTPSVDLSSAEDISHFMIWQNTGSSVEQYLEIHFSGSHTVDRIVLHFLNYPSENIGLPKLDLTHVQDVAQLLPFTIIGLDNLPADDRQVRSVTLNVSSVDIVDRSRFKASISFAGMNNINWFFLSEMSFCEVINFQEPLTDNTTVMPSINSLNTITLNCSVEGSVTYIWQWRKGSSIIQAGGRYNISIETRKTQLTISELDYADEDQYICEAKQCGQAAFCASRSIQLQLPGETAVIIVYIYFFFRYKGVGRN